MLSNCLYLQEFFNFMCRNVYVYVLMHHKIYFKSYRKRKFIINHFHSTFLKVLSLKSELLLFKGHKFYVISKLEDKQKITEESQ